MASSLQMLCDPPEGSTSYSDSGADSDVEMHSSVSSTAISCSASFTSEPSCFLQEARACSAACFDVRGSVSHRSSFKLFPHAAEASSGARDRLARASSAIAAGWRVVCHEIGATVLKAIVSVEQCRGA